MRLRVSGTNYQFKYLNVYLKHILKHIFNQIEYDFFFMYNVYVCRGFVQYYVHDMK